MSEYTNEEMAQACEISAAYTGVSLTKKLLAAATELRAQDQRSGFTNEEMADEVGVCASMVANVRANMVLRAAERTLRTMQAQEQSAATPSAITTEASQEAAAGPAADPPPPEDALLAEIDQRVKGLHASLKPPNSVHFSIEHPDRSLTDCGLKRMENQLILSDIDMLLRLRDRIAADAETIIDLAKLARQIGSRPCNEDHLELKEKLAAAEARAQRAEADTKRLDVLEMSIRDGSYDSIWNDIIGVCEHAYMTIGPGPALRAAIDAALARPEPERKDG